MSLNSSLPKLPYPEFPLRPHRNGKWFKSVWDRRTKKSRQYYFGSWIADPAGERALHDPVQGWLARREAIFAGIDHLRAVTVAGDKTLGELMRRFLQFKRDQVTAGELSAVTLGDYLIEVEAFVAVMKPSTPPSALRPEHFAAYRQHLVGDRKLGRHAVRRVRAYINCFLSYGAKNGWFTMPPTGAEWVAQAADPDAMRQARARSGSANQTWFASSPWRVPRRVNSLE